MARKKGVPNIKKHKWTGGIDTPDEEDGPHTLPQAAGASSSADLNSTDHSRAPADGNSNGHLPYPSNHNAAQDSPPPPPAVVQARSPRAFVRPDLSDKPMLPPGLMDLFAEVYVPLWLRSVNDAQAPFVPRSQAETLRLQVNNEALIDSLYPRKLILQLLALESQHRARVQAALIKVTPPPPAFIPPALHSSRIVPVRPGQKPEPPLTSPPPVLAPATPVQWSLEKEFRTKLPPLSPTKYAEYWVPLQLAEFAAREKQLRQARLYAVPVMSMRSHPNAVAAAIPHATLYVLQARSIREGWPPVDLGDRVELRQLRPNINAWQGLRFFATVDAVNRAKGEVMLRCDGLRGYEESMIFNVIWAVQDRHFLYWRRATETLDLALNPALPSTKPSRKSIVETWLFPTEEDIHEEPDADEVYDWPELDPTLNAEQRDAVKSIIWGRHTIPFLISGPPGTGKTKTIVEAVLRLLETHPETHILVCGASGPSADTLALRLRKTLKPSDLFRLNAPSRPFAEVRDELLPFCHVEDERFTLPETSVLLSKRVICCTVLDAALLLEARLSNHDLSTLQLHTLSSIHPRSRFALAKPHFGFLLVDEAAQASEPDLSCALSVVATDYSWCSPCHVTICGDSRQLGPHIVSPEARAMGLDASLLERLAEREVYRDHPYSRRNRGLNQDARWTLGTPFVDLTKNYRSATPILMLPSTLFYNETLEPYAPASTHNSALHRWSTLPNPGWPILFHGIIGDDFPIDEGASFYNDAEVTLITQYALSLVGSDTPHGPLRAKEISIISPFREQVWRIRLALRAVGLHDVDVGNVEALQGAENRVVMISAVRSTATRWLPADRAQARGLLFEPKRFNVAMTRAKELLIVIGNPNTLTLDPYWLAFYHFCLRNSCYKGPTLDYLKRVDQNGASNGHGEPADADEHDYAGDEEELDERYATAGVQAVSRLEQQWHAEHRTQSSSKRDFDLLVGRMVGMTFEE